MEMLERKIKLDRTSFADQKMQVAYNSNGHLTIRAYDENDRSRDTILTFTAEETRAIVRFIKEVL